MLKKHVLSLAEWASPVLRPLEGNAANCLVHPEWQERRWPACRASSAEVAAAMKAGS